ncbi:hypothetical protein E2320_012909, partial [Naja naja]
IHEELTFIGWKRTITHHPEGYLNQLVICSGAVELGFLQIPSVGLEMTCCLGWEEQMTLELQTLHWLPTSISLQFKMLVWKAIHGLAPENLWDHLHHLISACQIWTSQENHKGLRL